MSIMAAQINEEIGQLLSFTSYGKLKLDTLASQLQIFQKSLRKVDSRQVLRQIEREIEVFNVTLVTTLETVNEWLQKVEILRRSITKNDQLSKKLNNKVKRLENVLIAQQNRIQDLQQCYQRLAKVIHQKARMVKPNIILGREPLVDH